ncbi:MAG: hypothetical protein ACKPJD_34380, partial [Planctomycetaceae bacterium]
MWLVLPQRGRFGDRKVPVKWSEGRRWPSGPAGLTRSREAAKENRTRSGEELAAALTRLAGVVRFRSSGFPARAPVRCVFS